MRAQADNNTILVTGATQLDRTMLRTIPGAGWDPRRRSYRLPMTESSAQYLRTKFPSLYIDTDILAGIAKRDNRLQQAALLKEQTFTGKGNMPIKDIAPYGHQRSAYETGLALLADGGGYGLWHEMGTGKTLTGVALMGALGVSRVLIIAPVSVVAVWPKEIEAFADYEANVRTAQGTAKKRKETLAMMIEHPSEMDVLVINYEILGRNPEILGLVAEWEPELIIADEAHRLKNPTANQSKNIGLLGQAAKYRIAMSGTPVANKTHDIYGLYQWLDTSVFGSNYGSFKNRYCIQVPAPHGGKMVVGMKQEMLPELTEKMHSIAHRVSKEDALDLPPITEIDITVELEPKARKVYADLVSESISILEAEAVVAAHVLTRMLRLQQLTGGFVESVENTVTQISTAKANVLMDLLDAATGKTVIFARFTREIELIEELCEKAKLKTVKIDGSVPMSERGNIVRDFQEGDVPIFIGQTDAAGEGITLHAADTAIFYSKTLSLSKDDQAKSRIHRSGQERPVTFYNIVAEHTIDEKINKALKDKKDMAELVTDNWRELLQ